MLGRFVMTALPLKLVVWEEVKPMVVGVISVGFEFDAIWFRF